MVLPRVYLSGPMSIGDWDENIRKAEDVMKLLMVSGFSVLCPHLSGKIPWCHDVPHGDWVANDLPWVAVSDALYRIEGESVGADEEFEFARSLNIPVYVDLQALIADRDTLISLQRIRIEATAGKW